MLHLISTLQPYCGRVVFVHNGPLASQSRTAVAALNVEIVERENVGFDVWAYKAGIERIGYDELAKLDELLLVNHTFYGPIFPWDESFAKVPDDCDFWGLSAHAEVAPNPFTGKGILHYHLNSHFIAVRQPMLGSDDFRDYWSRLPTIESYTDSILKHEAVFTHYFRERGYRHFAIVEPSDYSLTNPSMFEVDEVIEHRFPALKRRLFFHTPLLHDKLAINLPRALRLIEETSNYDMSLIWENVGRLGEPRIIGTNSAALHIFPEDTTPEVPECLRVAVCIHAYYVEDLPELLGYAENIPVAYDVIVTTDTAEKKERIEAIIASHAPGVQFDVRVVAQNRGRDMSALVITCRDVFLADRYDAVCRLHTKRSPQDLAPRSREFKRHLLDNLLVSRGYVTNVLRLFQSNMRVGMVFPPVIHISYPTLGNAWFLNKPGGERVMRELDLRGSLDQDTPMAAFGTMFWFRPAALRKLFARQWKWEEFNAEPHHVDGGLAHILERMMTSICLDAGYSAQQVCTPRNAARMYTSLEYKMQYSVANQSYKRYAAVVLQSRAPAAYNFVIRLWRMLPRSSG
jgi:rhamnosyltransferase